MKIPRALMTDEDAVRLLVSHGSSSRM